MLSVVNSAEFGLILTRKRIFDRIEAQSKNTRAIAHSEREILECSPGRATEAQRRTTAEGSPARVRRSRINLQNLKIFTEGLASTQRKSFGSIPIPCNPFCEFCSFCLKLLQPLNSELKFDNWRRNPQFHWLSGSARIDLFSNTTNPPA